MQILDQLKLCKPALVYIIIAFILCICFLLINWSFESASLNLFSICCCTLILVGLCTLLKDQGRTLGWIFIIFYILSAILSVVSTLISKTNNYKKIY